MLRIGLIGASRIAGPAVIEPARLLDGVEVVAVAARDPVRAADFARRHAIPRVHVSYGELLDDPDIDLVYIGTPPHNHMSLALTAIAAGKPALVEKPFAMNAAEARAVHQRSVGAGVPVFEAMHSLHHPLFARIAALIASGVLGSLIHLEAEFRIPHVPDDDPFRWSATHGGGALMDLGVYPLAWCRYLAGDRFTADHAHAEFRRGVDAALTARLQFRNGPSASIAASFVSDVYRARLAVTGTLGAIEATNPVAPHTGHKLSIRTPERTWTETVDGPSTYLAQLTAVIDAIAGRAAFPLPDDDFVQSMVAIDSVRSAFQ